MLHHGRQYKEICDEKTEFTKSHSGILSSSLFFREGFAITVSQAILLAPTPSFWGLRSTSLNKDEKGKNEAVCSMKIAWNPTTSFLTHHGDRISQFSHHCPSKSTPDNCRRILSLKGQKKTEEEDYNEKGRKAEKQKRKRRKGKETGERLADWMKKLKNSEKNQTLG